MSEKGTAGMIAHPLLSSDMRDRKIKGGEICSVSKWKQRQIYKSLINISSFRNTRFLANQIQWSITSFQHISAMNSTDIWHGDFHHCAVKHISHAVPPAPRCWAALVESLILSCFPAVYTQKYHKHHFILKRKASTMYFMLTLYSSALALFNKP